ncbi:hypothetical protein VCR15J2_20098 [Vibrio coralliirubri]|nr:hypothetical protein VCR15J2_20098 [Vibrio coralliirubri]
MNMERASGTFWGKDKLELLVISDIKNKRIPPKKSIKVIPITA